MKKLLSALCISTLLILLTPTVSASSGLKSEFIGDTTYLSESMSTKAKFTGVIIEFEQEDSADDYRDFFIRFDEGSKWSEWISIRPDHDHAEEAHEEDGEHASTEYLINTNLSKGYQIYLYQEDGLDDIKPELHIEKLTFINAKAGDPKNQVGAFQVDSSPNVISRSQWGADESLLYGRGIDVTDEEHEDIDRVVYKDNGKELKWPRQYMEDVKMLVVHHTASVSDLNDPKQAIRNIYYYHSVRRGWGDIGYNYIVDTDGRIYEGRSGGEMVVGGHSVKVNKASIGVAVLGNYETQDVPKDVIQGLANILSDKADRYNLDVLDDVEYADKDYDVLSGHRDSAATTCPGKNLYKALPTLRYLVDGGQIYKERSKLSNWRYAYIDKDPLKDMLDLELGETKTVTIKLENVGKNTWNTSNTYLKVLNYNDVKHAVSIDGSKLGKLSSRVSTGGTATLEFDVTGGLGTGFHGLELLLTMNGSAKSELPIYVPIYLDNDFTFDISGKDEFELDLDPGEEGSISVKFKNTSSINWNDKYDVELKKSDGTSSRLLDKTDVLGTINAGRFKTVRIPIEAPSSKGSYTEYFVPVLEDNFYLEGEPIKVTVNVGSSSTSKSTTTVQRSSKPLVLNDTVTVDLGKTTSHEVELVNKTNESWKSSKFRVTVLGNKAVTVDNVELEESSVRPGYAGTIKMDINPSKSGTYKYQLRFYNGRNLVYKTPYRLTVKTNGSSSTTSSVKTTTTTRTVTTAPTTTKVVPTVQASAPTASITNSLGPDIRVHLSVFDIRSTNVKPHGLTDVYVDGTKIDSITARDNVRVYQATTNVKITINGKTTSGRVLRLDPVSQYGTITLEDLENRPGWNKALNDNRFRGVMEFRVDENKLKAINELALELYLRGLGEVSNSTNEESIKTILTAARSYAYHYITDGTKFAGRPYDLDDSPARSQKYIGYGFEQRSPNVTKAVKATAGKVVTYNGGVIKVPYFSRSTGRTKSAQEVWGWTNTPYLVSVADPYCSGQTAAGHGVGISGCGANGMALAGSNHEEIIKYFLKGVDFAFKY
jgi:peptidoglycan hydrolase-like amidase